MRRKEVSRRLGAVAEVRVSTRAHRVRVGGKLDGRPAAQRASALSQSYFDHMDEELPEIESDLITAEDAHLPKLVRIVQLRHDSDELAAEVYEKQIGTADSRRSVWIAERLRARRDVRRNASGAAGTD